MLEGIAEHQPIGLSELARALGFDKNAVQRAIVTLSQSGWIIASTSQTKGWELSARIYAVAHKSQARNDMRLRAKDELEGLRNDTGETALLTLIDNDCFFVADVFESRQILRTAPPIGTTISPKGSAAGYALLPYFPIDIQTTLLGEQPDKDTQQKFAQTLRNGYSVAIDTTYDGITVIAAPIFDAAGSPIAAITVVAPTERTSEAKHSEIGKRVAIAAERLSRGKPQITR